MMLSQREAAQTWRIGRETISAKIKSGELSLTSSQKIDPAEMLRVFGEPKAKPLKASALKASQGRTNPSEATQGQRPSRPPEATQGQGASHPDTTQLQAEIAHLKTLLVEKDARIEDLRGAMRLLTDQRTAEAPSKGFWARLRGR